MSPPLTLCKTAKTSDRFTKVKMRCERFLISQGKKKKKWQNPGRGDGLDRRGGHNQRTMPSQTAYHTLPLLASNLWPMAFATTTQPCISSTTNRLTCSSGLAEQSKAPSAVNKCTPPPPPPPHRDQRVRMFSRRVASPVSSSPKHHLSSVCRIN